MVSPEIPQKKGQMNASGFRAWFWSFCVARTSIIATGGDPFAGPAQGAPQGIPAASPRPASGWRRWFGCVEGRKAMEGFLEISMLYLVAPSHPPSFFWLSGV